MEETTEKAAVGRLELRLLDADVRASQEELNELLADAFIEFGSSGAVWTKAQIIAGLLGERASGAAVARRADGLQVKLLAEGVALVTYRATRRHRDDASEVHSLRSSLWKHDGRRWRMIFHQGTRVGSAEARTHGDDGG